MGYLLRKLSAESFTGRSSSLEMFLADSGPIPDSYVFL